MIMPYRRDIDILKGVAIIAVIFYHLGLLKTGYLGVDVFFVINGFFVVPSVFRSIATGEFSYGNYLIKKTLRFLPLIVIASLVSLLLGYILMLPDHYENLAQSAVAGNLMSENLLSLLTTKNYWDVVNDYKPLMHLWYVGILFEFYIILPFIIYLGIVINRSGERTVTTTSLTLSVLVIISFVLFLLPFWTRGEKFYSLPFRFFELGAGGIIGLNAKNWKINDKITRVKPFIWFFLLLILLCGIYSYIDGSFNLHNVIGQDASEYRSGIPLPQDFLLISIVVITCIFVLIPSNPRSHVLVDFLSRIGGMSYSIYIWHQVFIAFYRYSVGNKLTIWCIPVILLFLLSVYISYYCIERKQIFSFRQLAFWGIAALSVIIPSWIIYNHAGVTRDVPELDVQFENAHRGMFGEYCDRVFQYQNGFDGDTTKIKVIVVGVSFGRDFANILLESEYQNLIELNYCSSLSDPRLREWIKSCDYLFSFSSKDAIPHYIWEEIPSTAAVWGIGTKNFGDCNGPIYLRRSSPNYYTLSIRPSPGYLELNERMQKQWGNHYIDLMTPVLLEDGTVRVFTEDKKFISQDCRHLTPAGAKFYAKLLDLDSVFSH